jgi:hypothetical protein
MLERDQINEWRSMGWVTEAEAAAICGMKMGSNVSRRMEKEKITTKRVPRNGQHRGVRRLYWRQEVENLAKKINPMLVFAEWQKVNGKIQSDPPAAPEPAPAPAPAAPSDESAPPAPPATSEDEARADFIEAAQSRAAARDNLSPINPPVQPAEATAPSVPAEPVIDPDTIRAEGALFSAETALKACRETMNWINSAKLDVEGSISVLVRAEEDARNALAVAIARRAAQVMT